MLCAKPDDDGVNVLVPALHPRQAPHPEFVVYSLVTVEVIRYASPDHVSVEVKLLSEGRVQSHQLSSLAILSSRRRLYSAPSRVFPHLWDPHHSPQGHLVLLHQGRHLLERTGWVRLESTLRSREANLLAPRFTSEK